MFVVNIVFFYFIFRATTAVYKMVKKATVLRWNIPKIGIITADNDEEELKKIFCKICKEFYVDSQEGKVTLEKFTGNVKKVVQNWVSGSEIVKKNNAKDHVNKAKYPATAVRILRQRANEKAKITQQTEAEKLESQDKIISSESILKYSAITFCRKSKSFISYV